MSGGGRHPPSRRRKPLHVDVDAAAAAARNARTTVAPRDATAQRASLRKLHGDHAAFARPRAA